MPPDMRNITNQIHNVYIADGFADDCEELIHRCSQVSLLTFQVFCDIWKDMNFAAVFHGRSSGAEIAELSEEFIHIAKHYMVVNTTNFEESVAGLFLVYSLLNLQPFAGFAALRIVQDDVPAIQRLELVARRDKRYDALYILGAVLIQGPCQFHVMQRERGLECSLRKYLEGYTGGIDKLGVRPKGVFYRQNEELDIIRELNTIGRRYSDVKKVISGPSKPDRNLGYTNDNLPSELDKSLKKLITGIISDERVSDDDDSDAETKRGKSKHIDLLSIKERAMRTTVRPMNHLTGIQERKNTKQRPSPKKTDIRMSPGRIKSSSPTKAVATSSPRKRKSPPKSGKSRTHSPRKKKPKRQPRIKFESDSDSDESNLMTSDDDTELDSSKETSPEPQTELSDQEEPIPEAILEIDPVPVIEPVPEVEPVAEIEPTPDMCQELDIQINSLPVIIRTEHDGQLYEIEIIDNLESKNNITLPEPPTKKEKPEHIIKKLPDVSIKKIEGTSDFQKVTAKESNEMAQISKISYGGVAIEPVKIKKLDRRELKKTGLKSKFKRMGILPVANFQDPDKIP